MYIFEVKRLLKYFIRQLFKKLTVKKSTALPSQTLWRSDSEGIKLPSTVKGTQTVLVE